MARFSFQALLRHRFSPLAGVALCFLLAWVLQQAGRTAEITGNPLSAHTAKFADVLHQREALLEQELVQLEQLARQKSYHDIFLQQPAYYDRLGRDQGFVLLIYERDTLQFWSDNSVAVENYMKEVCLDDRLARLKNGWFEVRRRHDNTGRTFIGLLLIKYAYPYQNENLQNGFHASFALPGEADVQASTPNAINSINDKEGNYLLTLTSKSVSASAGLGWRDWLSVLLYAIGFVLLLWFVKRECEALQQSIGALRSTLLFGALLVSLRVITILLRFPALFDELPLFSPVHYGNAESFWLPSLGDFLINALLLFFLARYFSARISFAQLRIPQKYWLHILGGLVALTATAAAGMVINSMVSGLVQNSDISYNLNDIFSLNRFSYVALCVIALLLAAFFVLADRVVAFLHRLFERAFERWMIFLTASALHVAAMHLLGMADVLVICWPLGIVLFLLLRNHSQPYSFAVIVVLLFLFSLTATHLLIRESRYKEHDTRLLLAEKLAAEQDPVAELLFAELENRLTHDSVLINLAQQPQPDWNAFERYIRQNYFNGYWDTKYNLKVTYYDTLCSPLHRSESPWTESLTLAEELIADKGSEAMSKNFHYLDLNSGRTSYAGLLKLQRKGENKPLGRGLLFLELESKLMVQEIGFPELLLDRELGINKKLINYSYAKYKNDELLNHSGKYTYNIHPGELNTKLSHEFIKYEDWNHLVFRPDTHTLVILSKPQLGWLGRVTTFSYLFAMFSLLLITVFSLRQLVTVGFTFSNLTFKSRIQLVFVFIVLASLGLFGVGSIIFIRDQYQNKNEEIISDKTHSVRLEIEAYLKEKNYSLNPAFANYLLNDISNVFGTDVNMFDLRGNLYASSRQKLFDEGLISRKMNPEAFNELSIKGASEFIHDEHIGNLDYLSAYLPVRNKDGQLEAYLNFPYFARQSALEKEISQFLVALINIYVLLFALSVLAAIFVSNYLTHPLRLIQEKMRQVKLGKTNDPIQWHNHDEIGSLVFEYNRMITELAQSAEKLAQSERESAWREMAKQVAHEIKNPLTPMRLSIQLFERAYKDKAPGIDEKIERMSKTLIEQIDTLASIANAFSDFAKMPKVTSERMDLLQMARNTVELFRDTSEGMDISFDAGNLTEAQISADKEQLVRVFNNLLKNAVQAIPEERTGKITVTLTRQPTDTGPRYLLAFADNGTGIADEVIDKIFVPNFTTKTAGMGLGLAMVKNIVEHCGGKIWFETAKDKGTTFFVSFPEWRE
ncbi:MAG: ATP-binding protein [Bacteroidia bacterium]|jgi:signal transduction histidine kinase|nr:ATP-binding protein [Bacteroidia bacterium]